jgi:hypothetical protein
VVGGVTHASALNQPKSIAVSRDGSFLYVASVYSDSAQSRALSKITAVNVATPASPFVPAPASYSIVVAGLEYVVASHTSDYVYAIGYSSTVSTGGYVRAYAVQPSGELVAGPSTSVLVTGSGTLTSTTTRVELRRPTCGVMSPDGNYLFVGTEAVGGFYWRLIVIDVTTPGTPVYLSHTSGLIDSGSQAIGWVSTSPDGNFVYARDQTGGYIHKVNVTVKTNPVILGVGGVGTSNQYVMTPQGPGGSVPVSPDGAVLYAPGKIMEAVNISGYPLIEIGVGIEQASFLGTVSWGSVLVGNYFFVAMATNDTGVNVAHNHYVRAFNVGNPASIAFVGEVLNNAYFDTATPLQGREVGSMARSADGRYLYVTGYAGDSVSVLSWCPLL